MWDSLADEVLEFPIPCEPGMVLYSYDINAVCTAVNATGESIDAHRPPLPLPPGPTADEYNSAEGRR